jgi:hypothetical protein
MTTDVHSASPQWPLSATVTNDPASIFVLFVCSLNPHDVSAAAAAAAAAFGSFFPSLSIVRAVM